MTEEAFDILEQEIWREYLEQATPYMIVLYIARFMTFLRSSSTLQGK